MKDSVESSIIKILKENAITDENLLDLTPELIREMIPQIGLRLEFLKKWTAVFKKEKTRTVELFYYFRLRNEDFLYIAEEIVKLFPTEATTTYYIPPIPKKLSRVGKSVISRGKLVDKYRNKIRALKLIDEWKPLGDRQDYKTESSDSSSDEGSLYWPILKHPNAYTLIEEDYSYLKLPTQELTLESWRTFFKKILAVRPPKKDDGNAQALLELIQCTLNDNAKIVQQLKLLPHLLPPKSRIRLKKNQWKPSIPELWIIRLLILLRRLPPYYNIIFLQLIADITKVQEERRKTAASLGITLQPFIIAVGPSNADISDIFISVDDTLYKVPSTIQAIDLCYKIFQVFDIKYPIESTHIWLLFQRVLYSYENCFDKMTPNITEAISDMMAFQDKDT
ncbi:PREDICTED: uncharacterized protein LOC105571267 [Vollenhovia emeryi]|uniref:uncharacterized protein LOC105571267 n=1 Tax=Vollenhovia emeryi TaxID=411798 RepID=UPI0005F54EF4|nr:PREDICTED: uncharacterized protein LOC105571267 [Vollenhovia emeryi]